MFKNKFRIVVAILLFLAGVLNYLDRSALAVMAPLVKKDLALNDAQMGLLYSAFFIGYCVFCFIGGIAADKFGPRKVYASAAFVWSFFCGATAVVTSFGQLLFVRILFGIGEGPMGTTTNKSISNWFPKKEIGRAVGFTNAGQPLGAAIAAPIVGLVGIYYSWRIAFIAVGLLGLIWVVAWLKLFRDKPENHPFATKEECLLISEGKHVLSEVKFDHSAQPHAAIWTYIFSAPRFGNCCRILLL